MWSNSTRVVSVLGSPVAFNPASQNNQIHVRRCRTTSKLLVRGAGSIRQLSHLSQSATIANTRGLHFQLPHAPAAKLHLLVESSIAIDQLQPVSKETMCGGELEILKISGLNVAPAPDGRDRRGEERNIRVWTPPGYDSAKGDYPVLYLNDGQNLFNSKESFSGVSWEAASTASELILAGVLPPFIIVGIDHANEFRSLDYLPCRPGTGAGNFRPEASGWPGGGVEQFLKEVVETIVPAVSQKYGASTDPAKTSFGGSSFGGICGLYMAMRYPEAFGSVLVESPSFWMDDAKVLDVLSEYSGAWPERVFLASGECEFSGTRDRSAPAGKEVDSLLNNYFQQAVLMLRTKGLDEARMQSFLEPDAAHNEADWARRFPKALESVFSNLWDNQAYQTHLAASKALAAEAAAAAKGAASSGTCYFTVPKVLVAGELGHLFYMKTGTGLKHASRIQAHVGFNGWSVGVEDLPMSTTELDDVLCVPVRVPVDATEGNFCFFDTEGNWDSNNGSNYSVLVAQPDPVASAPAPEPAGPVPEAVAPVVDAKSSAAAASEEKPAGSKFFEQMSDEDKEKFAKEQGPNGYNSFYFSLPGTLEPGEKGTIYVNRNLSMPLQGSSGPLKLLYGFNSWQMGNGEVELSQGALPSIDGADWWAGEFTAPKGAVQMNFVLNAGDQWDNNNEEDHTMLVEDPALRAPVSDEKKAEFDKVAAEVWEANGAKFFFTVPSPLVAGQPGAVYMNRKRSIVGLADKQPVMFTGFNSWSVGNSEQVMVQTELPKYDDIDWFAGYFNVPDSAFEQALAFCDTDKVIYDNNDDNDYMTQVTAKAKRPPRTIACIESEQDMAGGKLQVVRLNARPGASRRSKWKEERMIRVWTPPGYHKDMCGEKGIPVLYLNDGKNLFEDWLAHQGVSWNAGHCAGHLIGSGKLPPFMIVGIDSPGPFRSQCYLPFPPGIGIHDHRPDAAKWPGGEVEPYMERVVQELLPMINTEYGGSLERERLCFGGASFGGVNAIYTAMYYPDVFSSVLVESPSLWSGMGRFLGTMYEHEGEWAERIFMGTGTLEYSYTRDHDWPEMDYQLLKYTEEAMEIMERKGVTQSSGRLAYQVEQGAGHIESAWGGRLYGSLQFLCRHWFDEMNK